MKKLHFLFFSIRLQSRLKLKSQRGFTLVEMIVSMGIFAVVAVVALGATAKIISANRKAQALQSSITNLNYAIDSMAREMSSGINFYCVARHTTWSIGPNPVTRSDCPVGYSGLGNNDDQPTILFNNVAKRAPSNDCNFVYGYQFGKFDEDKFEIKKTKQSSSCTEILDDSMYSSIIDPNVTITSYYVAVKQDLGLDLYPLITIRVSGYAGFREKERSYFDIQTVVSPRQNKVL